MRHRVALAVTVIAAVAGPSCVPDTAGPPARPVPSAVAPSRVGPDAAASALADAGGVHVAIAEGSTRWRSVPREDNGFYAAVDGICSQLVATPIGKDVVVYYGGNNSIYVDNLRRGDASFIAIRGEAFESIGDPSIESPTGVAGTSLDDFWIGNNTGSRSGSGSVIHRQAGGTWKAHAKDQMRLHAWVDGGVIGQLGVMANNGELWVEGSKTVPPPAFTADVVATPVFAAFPTGDVLIFSFVGTGLMPDQGARLLARHWAPGKKVTQVDLERLIPDPDQKFPSITEVAPNEVYAERAGRVARWDGSTFRLLAKPSKAIVKVLRAAPDDLWVSTTGGGLEHVTATTATATAIATPEPIADIDGAGSGAWMLGKSGKLYRRDGEEWKAMPLPAPPFSSSGAVFKAKRIVVAAADDVLLTGTYWEKGPSWKDQELHTALFRTKRVNETLRCNEPDPENNNIQLGHGFQSWPPIATAECKTPFAVLARRSKAIKNDDGWPRIRASLKGHTELGAVSLVDFVSGDRTFVGAKAKDLETAKALVALVAKTDRLRPEIVCGDPEPKRTLAVDLVTGAAALVTGAAARP